MGSWVVIMMFYSCVRDCAGVHMGSWEVITMFYSCIQVIGEVIPMFYSCDGLLAGVPRRS